MPNLIGSRAPTLTCVRREALLQYLGGFDAALAHASLPCPGVDFTECDPSKEVVGGRPVDLGSVDPTIEGEALEGVQGVMRD